MDDTAVLHGALSQNQFPLKGTLSGSGISLDGSLNGGHVGAGGAYPHCLVDLAQDRQLDALAISRRIRCVGGLLRCIGRHVRCGSRCIGGAGAQAQWSAAWRK